MRSNPAWQYLRADMRRLLYFRGHSCRVIVGKRHILHRCINVRIIFSRDKTRQKAQLMHDVREESPRERTLRVTRRFGFGHVAAAAADFTTTDTSYYASPAATDKRTLK